MLGGAVLCLFSVISSAAEDSAYDLTLSEAIAQALRTNPAVTAAQSRYRATEGRVAQARAGYRPTVRSAAEFGEGWRNDLDRQYLTITASQLLYDFGQTQARIDIEEAERDILYADYQLEKNDLTVDVTEAYLEIIRHQQLIRVVDEKLDRIRTIERVAETRLSLGGSDNADLVLTRSRYQAALSEMVELRSQILEWQQILSSLTQMPVSQIDPSLVAIDELACSVTQQALLDSLYLANSQRNIDSARATFDYASRKNYPEISLQIGARQLLRSSQFEPRDQDYRIEIKFEMDLYNGGKNRAEASSSLHMIDSATMSAKAVELDISRRARRAQSDIRFINEKAEILRQQISAASDARDLFLEQYRTLGNRSLTDILNNEEDIARVAMQIVNADFDRKLSLLECASLTENLADILNTSD